MNEKQYEIPRTARLYSLACVISEKYLEEKQHVICLINELLLRFLV